MTRLAIVNMCALTIVHEKCMQQARVRHSNSKVRDAFRWAMEDTYGRDWFKEQ